MYYTRFKVIDIHNSMSILTCADLVNLPKSKLELKEYLTI